MDHLVINWAEMPTYNTLMAVCAGASLISAAKVGKNLILGNLNTKGWAINFAVLGLILFVSGAHMSLTWPIKFLPFDNIIFGETSFAIGVLDLALAFYLWKNANRIETSTKPIALVSKELNPLKYFLIGLGLSLAFIAISGYEWKFFVAPVEEPISGPMGQKFPTMQYISLSSIFLLIGIAAVLTAIFFSNFSKEKATVQWHHKLNYGLLLSMGWTLLVFGAFVFYTHIGFIITTMPH